MIDELSAGGYLPASFLDWDGRVASVIFTAGCNFRCPWCHNSELVREEAESVPIAKILADIKRRRNFLDGVVITGGEPCLWSGLFVLLNELKTLSLPVKLDTNGSFPEILEKIFDMALISHIAMDVKAPLDAERIKIVTGSGISPDILKKSIKLIKSKAPSYEFRTTYTPRIMSEDDLHEIRSELSDDSHWIIQCFKPVNCLDESFLECQAVRAEELKKIFPQIKIRG